MKHQAPAHRLMYLGPSTLQAACILSPQTSPETSGGFWNFSRCSLCRVAQPRLQSWSCPPHLPLIPSLRHQQADPPFPESPCPLSEEDPSLRDSPAIPPARCNCPLPAHMASAAGLWDLGEPGRGRGALPAGGAAPCPTHLSEVRSSRPPRAITVPGDSRDPGD